MFWVVTVVLTVEPVQKVSADFLKSVKSIISLAFRDNYQESFEEVTKLRCSLLMPDRCQNIEPVICFKTNVSL